MLLIVDWHSNKFFTFLLRKKSESSQYLAWWLIYARTHLGHPVKNLHMDDGELNETGVRAVLDSIKDTGGTKLVVTGVNQSKQNPKAERGIRTLQDTMRASMSVGGANPDKWEFAAVAGTSARNKIPKTTALGAQMKNGDGTMRPRPRTPDEIWENEDRGSYKYQMRFTFPPFCLGVAHIAKPNRDNKSESKRLKQPGYPAIYLCPATGHHAVKFKDEIHRKIGHIVLDTRTRRIEFCPHFAAQLDVFPWAKDLTGEDAQDKGLIKRGTKRKKGADPQEQVSGPSQAVIPGKVTSQEAPCDTTGVIHEEDEEMKEIEEVKVEQTFEHPSPEEVPEISKPVFSSIRKEWLPTRQVWSSHHHMFQRIPIESFV